MTMAFSTSDNANLSSLLSGLVPSNNITEAYISSLQLDSRNVTPGSLFFGKNGAQTSGRHFVNDAIEKGASAIVIESESNSFELIDQVPVYEVNEIKSVLGTIASRFYDFPSAKIDLTGITGTNGKTSVVYFLNQAISICLNKPVGIIGTLGYGTANNLSPAINTTPDIITLNALLNDFYSRGIEEVVMEVSSHGIDQGRVNNIEIDTAVFTNLSQDHLDYHKDMDAYGKAKQELFYLSSIKNAVINVGDDFGLQISSDLPENINLIRYKVLEHDVDINAQDSELYAVIKHHDIYSISMEIFSEWGNEQLTVNLVGDYNAENILACLGVLCIKNIPFTDALEALSKVKAVPGRMELFCAPTSPKIFIDYAHTPDALEKSLSTLRKLGCRRLVCVFGCGGDRDKEKRPLMGKIAEKYCDGIFLTSDNSRNESAKEIIEDIQLGMSGVVACEVELDRTLAIQEAIDTYGSDDFILVAGKGHETYQETNGVKVPFCDRQLVINLLESLW